MHYILVIVKILSVDSLVDGKNVETEQTHTKIKAKIVRSHNGYIPLSFRYSYNT